MTVWEPLTAEAPCGALAAALGHRPESRNTLNLGHD